MAFEQEQTETVEKRKPGRPKGAVKRGRPRADGQERSAAMSEGSSTPKKRGPKPGKKRGPKPGARLSGGAGLIGKAVAKQVKAALKAERSQNKDLVRSLVAKELKKALKALLR